METLNHLLNRLFEAMLRPFHGMNPVYGLAGISVVTGILMLVVFRYTSDQKGIKRAKNHVKAHFLAIRLYKDDLAQMLTTMKNIIVSNLRYMSKSLKPMLFMFVPVALILIQLDSRYEHRPFKVGEATVVTVRLGAGEESLLHNVSLVVPDGIQIETPAVRIAARAEVCWRIRMQKEGSHDLQVLGGPQPYTKRIEVSSDLMLLASNKERQGFLASALSPAETGLPAASPIESITMTYPKRDLKAWGMSVNWLVGFFVVSLIAGFSLKGVFKVEI